MRLIRREFQSIRQMLRNSNAALTFSLLGRAALTLVSTDDLGD